MESPYAIIVAIGALILILEGFMWELFRMKIVGIAFPNEADNFLFRFFIIAKGALFAFIHTVFLISAIAITYSILW